VVSVYACCANVRWFCSHHFFDIASEITHLIGIIFIYFFKKLMFRVVIFTLMVDCLFSRGSKSF